MAEEPVRRRPADLCDALLLKLISGEPRLKDVLKLVEMAA